MERLCRDENSANTQIVIETWKHIEKQTARLDNPPSLGFTEKITEEENLVHSHIDWIPEPCQNWIQRNTNIYTCNPNPSQLKYWQDQKAGPWVGLSLVKSILLNVQPRASLIRLEGKGMISPSSWLPITGKDLYSLEIKQPMLCFSPHCSFLYPLPGPG